MAQLGGCGQAAAFMRVKHKANALLNRGLLFSTLMAPNPSRSGPGIGRQKQEKMEFRVPSTACEVAIPGRSARSR